MKSIIKILLVVLMSGISMAQAQTLTLDSILAVVRDQNPTMAQYEQRIRAMEAYAEGATAWMAPMIGAGTFMTPYPGLRNGEKSDKGMLMFSVEQEIPNPARLKARQAYLNSKAAIESSAQEYSFNDLRYKAKIAYYQWVVNEKKLSVLEENLKIIHTMKKLADIRYPYNQGSLGNIYKVQARGEEVENMILMTTAAIQQKNIQLNTLMDIPLDTQYNIDTTVNFNPVLTGIDTAELASRRSDIQQMNQTIQSMRLNTRLKGLESKPDFKIRFDHMSPWLEGMPSQYTVMGMISIPIVPWASKMYKYEVRGMEYEIQAMRKEREAMLNEVQGMVAGMATEISSMRRQLENYKNKIIPALRKNYQTLMLAYEENSEELPMVIDGWEALNMAQMQYLDQMEKYLVMMVEYEKQIEK